MSSVKPTPVLSSNEPLRGQKAELYEGGIRVPAFVNWPGKLAPRKINAPMHVSDWFPTLAALLDWKPTSDLKWDGQNMWPVLTGVAEPTPADDLYSLSQPVGLSRWRLEADRASSEQRRRNELFDLTADPYEKSDLAASQADRVSGMAAKLTETRKADRTQLPEDLRRVPDEEPRKVTCTNCDRGWHALRNEGRGLAMLHALRSSGRATQSFKLFFRGPLPFDTPDPVEDMAQ